MNKSDKALVIFYIIFGISFISIIIYLDNSLEKPPTDLDAIGPTRIDTVAFTKQIGLDKKKIFEAIADVDNYPIMLPQNVLSVKIINKTDNVVYAEEVLKEGPLKTRLVVKHTFIPYEKHVLEVIDGDAKGTVMTQTFEEINAVTQLKTEIKPKLKGQLEIFNYFPQSTIQQTMSVAIDDVFNYARGFDSPSKKTVDNLYREILRRPADPQGLQYYASRLESGKMTADNIKQTLLNSDEYKKLLTPNELKSIDELSAESKKTVDNLYREILHRPADPQGLQYYASSLESGKMTADDIRQALLNSDEYKSLK